MNEQEFEKQLNALHDRVITTSAGFFCLFNNLAKVSPLSIFQSDL